MESPSPSIQVLLIKFLYNFKVIFESFTFLFSFRAGAHHFAKELLLSNREFNSAAFDNFSAISPTLFNMCRLQSAKGHPRSETLVYSQITRENAMNAMLGYRITLFHHH